MNQHPHVSTGGRRHALQADTTRRLFAAASAVVVAVVMIAWGAPPVAARPAQCSQAVVDTSGSVDVAAVIAAIAEVDPEVTLIVRSFDRVSGGDLVGAVDRLVVDCFGDDDLGVRPDVIILAVSVGDRQSDVVIGGRWRPAIPEPETIRNDVMGPFFGEDDFTGGLLAGVEEIAIVVGEQLLAEATAETVDPAGSASTTGQDGDRQPDESVSFPETTDGGQSPWTIGGGLAAVGLGGGAFYVINRHRRLSSARAELERAIAAPLARQGTLRERDGRLVAQADLWMRTSAGRTKDVLWGAMSRLDDTRNETDRTRSIMAQATPDGAAKADLDEIERANSKVLGLSRALDDHDEALDRLEALGAHLDHLRIAVPTKVTLLDEELAESHDLADQRESEGWAVEGSRQELHSMEATIDALVLDDLELDLLELSDRVEAAEAQLFATNHYLQSLPSRLASLKQWTAGLDAAAALELKRIDELRREFSSMAVYHASDSWRWAADLPEQAIEHLNRSDAIQERVITELVSRQAFDEAGHELDKAGLELIAADRLLDQVDDLVVDLDRAMEEAPGIVAESRQVLKHLTEFVNRNQVDLDEQLLAAPGDLASAIVGVEQELRQVKPNYLRVAETGDRINRQIDEILAEAKEQHLRMESLRRELAREIARAERSIGRARRSLGWELFQSRDGRAIDGLEQDLRRLPDEVESAIAAAADIADDALRIQERIIGRRRRSGTWISTGGGGWTSGGGGWSSGGGSSRRSSSRSGGGRSFGRTSSRSGGGRSFGSGRSSGSF